MIDGNDLDLSMLSQGYAVSQCVRPACDTHNCTGGATCREDTEGGFTCLCSPEKTGNFKNSFI